MKNDKTCAFGCCEIDENNITKIESEETCVFGCCKKQPDLKN